MGATQQSKAENAAPPSQIDMGGNFSYTDQNGKPLSSDEVKRSKSGQSAAGTQPPPPPPAPTPYYLTKSTTPTPAPAPPATSGSYWSEPSSQLPTSSTPTPAPTPPAGPFGSSFDIGEYIRANDTYSRWKGPSTSSTAPGHMAGDAQSTLGQLAETQAQAQGSFYTDEARRRSKKFINKNKNCTTYKLGGAVFSPLVSSP